MEKYRVVMVFWQDAVNNDCDYMADFDTETEARLYIHRHMSLFTKQAKGIGKMFDDVAVDIGIELWHDNEDYDCMLWSTELWRKEN